MRGEGRELFCKKAPFLPPAPPIHPAKNLTGRMKGSAFPPGRSLTDGPPVRRRFSFFVTGMRLKRFAFEKGKTRGGGTTLPSRDQAEKARFFRETTGHMV